MIVMQVGAAAELPLPVFLSVGFLADRAPLVRRARSRSTASSSLIPRHGKPESDIIITFTAIL